MFALLKGAMYSLGNQVKVSVIECMLSPPLTVVWLILLSICAHLLHYLESYLSACLAPILILACHEQHCRGFLWLHRKKKNKKQTLNASSSLIIKKMEVKGHKRVWCISRYSHRKSSEESSAFNIMWYYNELIMHAHHGHRNSIIVPFLFLYIIKHPLVMRKNMHALRRIFL